MIVINWLFAFLILTGCCYFIVNFYYWILDEIINYKISSQLKQEKVNKLKNIKELSKKEAKEILKFVYNNKEYYFTGLSFNKKIIDGKEQVTMNLQSIIGIEFYNGQDSCLLRFNNSKVVLWLYKNCYDITELLEENSYFSDLEIDFDNFSYAIARMTKGEDGFKEGFKHKWTLDYVKNKCQELLNKYYYKNY